MIDSALQSLAVPVASLNPDPANTRRHDQRNIDVIKASLTRFGQRKPIVVQKKGMIVRAGNGTLQAAKELGWTEIAAVVLDDDDLTATAFSIADNRSAELATWHEPDLARLLKELEKDIDVNELGFDAAEMTELLDAHCQQDGQTDDDAVPDVPDDCDIKRGDLFQLGANRLLCGDSTLEADFAKLMGGEKAELGFNDPPYGMGKESDGVIGDNLNYSALLDFNKKWISIQFKHITDNGSWYCWGMDEPLMDIYSEILKPFIKTQKATFRNLITWNKGVGQGQNSDDYRMYPIADEKCLFVMMGVQGFNNNADNYFEGWEPVRNYLLESRKAMGWDIPTMKRIAGHSDLSRDHWTGKSQFNFPTREVYNKFKAEANRVRTQSKNNAFKKEYDELKKEYDELKKEYYSTRAFFNNTHDNQNNIWTFGRVIGEEREAAHGHPTPKPIALCERAIKSSCQEKNIVIDSFLGSGSTLIACEKLGRRCFGMEISPHYCAIILKRWEDFTGKRAVKLT